MRLHRDELDEDYYKLEWDGAIIYFNRKDGQLTNYVNWDRHQQQNWERDIIRMIKEYLATICR